eukprot:scaffold7202_cov110-Isochrysis_galbana.AAC.2
MASHSKLPVILNGRAPGRGASSKHKHAGPDAAEATATAAVCARVFACRLAMPAFACGRSRIAA